MVRIFIIFSIPYLDPCFDLPPDDEAIPDVPETDVPEAAAPEAGTASDAAVTDVSSAAVELLVDAPPPVDLEPTPETLFSELDLFRTSRISTNPDAFVPDGDDPPPAVDVDDAGIASIRDMRTSFTFSWEPDVELLDSVVLLDTRDAFDLDDVYPD